MIYRVDVFLYGTGNDHNVKMYSCFMKMYESHTELITAIEPAGSDVYVVYGALSPSYDTGIIIFRAPSETVRRNEHRKQWAHSYLCPAGKGKQGMKR